MSLGDAMPYIVVSFFTTLILYISITGFIADKYYEHGINEGKKIILEQLVKEHNLMNIEESDKE